MIAVIGGSGLTQLANLEITRRQIVRTPYGEPSGPVTFGHMGASEVVFLARHGYGHTLAPHEVNYRANLWALQYLGVTRVIAVATVGGIAAELGAGSIALPDQIIDYTWGRPSTYFEGSEHHPVIVEALGEPLLKQAESPDFDYESEIRGAVEMLEQEQRTRRGSELLRLIDSGEATPEEQAEFRQFHAQLATAKGNPVPEERSKF